MPVMIPVCLSILSAISYIFSIPNSNSNDFIPVIKSLARHNSEFKFELGSSCCFLNSIRQKEY